MSHSKPRVICFADSVNSPCSYWRALGPLYILEKEGLIDMVIGDWNNTWTSLSSFDIAFFQRPMASGCFLQVAEAKDCGCKVVVDLDDYNYIPEDHVIYREYKELYDENTFMRIMMLADVVTTTTEYLRQHYSMYNNNVVVIPNAINDSIIKQKKIKQGKNILLRAGTHHEHDIYYYKDEIIRVMKNLPDWRLLVLGSDPIFLRKEIENYYFVGDIPSVKEYFGFILNSDCSVFLTPLVDDSLNRGKSNIAWQEATISGAVSVVPSWYEINNINEKSFTYCDKVGFLNEFANAVFSTSNHRSENKFNNSVEELKEKYMLSTVNKKRLEVLMSVLK